MCGARSDLLRIHPFSPLLRDVEVHSVVPAWLIFLAVLDVNGSVAFHNVCSAESALLPGVELRWLGASPCGLLLPSSITEGTGCKGMVACLSESLA